MSLSRFSQTVTRPPPMLMSSRHEKGKGSPRRSFVVITACRWVSARSSISVFTFPSYMNLPTTSSPCCDLPGNACRAPTSIMAAERRESHRRRPCVARNARALRTGKVCADERTKTPTRPGARWGSPIYSGRIVVSSRSTSRRVRTRSEEPEVIRRVRRRRSRRWLRRRPLLPHPRRRNQRGCPRRRWRCRSPRMRIGP